MLLLANKVALVTGASRGIGAAIAVTLAQQGALVAGTATSVAGAEKISHALQEQGLKGKGFVLNLNDEASMKNLMSELSTFGLPNIYA